MKQPWKKIGLTNQSPRIFCHCDQPQPAKNSADGRCGSVLVCLCCSLVVWR